MPAQSSQPVTFDPAVLGELVCPACLRPLRLEEASLVCTGCARSYPVVDGIPVLIAERAETASRPSGWKPIAGNTF
jgi:uncharacterized protein YbaR (Trm112 family)